MPISPTRFIKRCSQWREKGDIHLIPPGTRGVYALLDFHSKTKYDVVYVGMAATGGIRGRLQSHRRSSTKIWTHFSVFEVWDNISEEEVKELEGLFREIYRRDGRANRFNKQKRYRKFRDACKKDLSEWKERKLKKGSI